MKVCSIFSLGVGVRISVIKRNKRNENNDVLTYTVRVKPEAPQHILPNHGTDIFSTPPFIRKREFLRSEERRVGKECQ